MGKKDPLDPKSATTKWNQISADELEARLQRQAEYRQPINEIVQVMEEALAGVLMFLGIDVSQPREAQQIQQDAAGIVVYMNDDERTPQLNGYFIHVDYDNFAPFAWVGTPFIEDGKAWCYMELFTEGRRFRVGGIKLIRKDE